MKKIISSTILLTLLFTLLPSAYADESGKDLFASGDFSSWVNGKGNPVEHWLNGIKLLEIELGSKDWDKRFQASKYTKYAGFGTWVGSIQLQDHGDKVWYRNIRIKRL